VAEIHGARAALDNVREIADVRLDKYQPYWAAQAELLAKAGAHGEARHACEIAIGLERDPAVHRFLWGRQSALPS
jgi:RNA polymerase sigma-70 factor, ECF subfamily